MRFQAGDTPQQSGFTATGGTHNGDQFAFVGQILKTEEQTSESASFASGPAPNDLQTFLKTTTSGRALLSPAFGAAAGFSAGPASEF